MLNIPGVIGVLLYHYEILYYDTDCLTSTAHPLYTHATIRLADRKRNSLCKPKKIAQHPDVKSFYMNNITRETELTIFTLMFYCIYPV